MTNEEKKPKEVKLFETKQIELPKIDVSQYVGKDVEIKKVVEMEGIHGYFVSVETEIVETIERTDKDNIELKGTRNFGLFTDDAGQVGWGKDTKLGQFLTKMNVEHYKDLLGKIVKLQTQTAKDTGTDFLTFN